MSPMPELPLPDLDDLRFQPLVDAAKRALPGRAPDWSDHNVSDPGVTLIEACAERVDLLLYRVARMTPAQRDRLLRLMGITPVPATPCRVRVRFSDTVGVPETTVPEGTELRSGGDPAVVLRTVSEVEVPRGGSATVEAVEQPEEVREVLGTSAHVPAQRFRPARRPWSPPVPLPEPPASPLTSVTVEGRVWAPVRSFARAGDQEECYWWDEATGEVVFGPLVPFAGGSRQIGAVPPQGATIAAEYTACRGTLSELPPGTPLYGAAGVPSAKADRILAAGQDAETWREALDRAALGLAPLRRAVTVQDHERLLSEHASLVARCRVSATVRPADTTVPAGLPAPPRPVPLSTCAVPVRPEQQPWAVHYFPGGTGVAYKRVLLLDGSEQTASGDAPPEFAKAKVDAVLHLKSAVDRLWFVGERCAWGAAASKLISEQFLGLPDEFAQDLNAVAALPVPDADDEYEVFLFKGETFYHRRYKYAQGTLCPSVGRGVRSLIAESFPGLSPDCQRSPDAVVTVGGVFYFLKGPRTEPAGWHSEEAALRVLLVPPLPSASSRALTEDELTVPRAALEETKAVLSGARLLGERLHAGPPDYAGFKVKATVHPWARNTQAVKDAAVRALFGYFHPTQGGPDGQGWAWGRRVHAGDVFTALEKVPEIRAVGDAQVTDEEGATRTAIEVSDSGLVHLLAVDITVEKS
ncbi:hypothetical protein ACH4SK_06905 [Streptomyces inhibens]|uniref:hypothetical protein n=1 Tax=Streptomyces inhibens TaxID=2293571 RepID=UPI003798E55A